MLVRLRLASPRPRVFPTKRKTTMRMPFKKFNFTFIKTFVKTALLALLRGYIYSIEIGG
jgi:hypothetical protein